MNGNLFIRKMVIRKKQKIKDNFKIKKEALQKTKEHLEELFIKTKHNIKRMESLNKQKIKRIPFKSNMYVYTSLITLSFLWYLLSNKFNCSLELTNYLWFVFNLITLAVYAIFISRLILKYNLDMLNISFKKTLRCMNDIEKKNK